jgi:hypothetical protein
MDNPETQTTLDIERKTNKKIKKKHVSLGVKEVRVMVSNATFNNISVISWRSVLLVEDIGVPGENRFFCIT